MLSPLTKKTEMIAPPPPSQSVGATGARLNRGRRVLVKMWDGTVVRGAVTFVFGDGSCDVKTVRFLVFSLSR